MEFEHIEYKGITFPVRDCIFTHGKKTINRLIGSEIMVDVLWKKEGVYADDKAQEIDERIAYYVPHDELMSLSDKQMLDYIFYHIDEGIMEDF